MRMLGELLFEVIYVFCGMWGTLQVHSVSMTSGPTSATESRVHLKKKQQG